MAENRLVGQQRRLNAEPLSQLSYPAFSWSKGYIYLAQSPLELCTHPRSLFPETVRKARAGEIFLVDATGRYFQVEDWTHVKPFGGIKGFGMQLLGSIFAAPVLTHETQLSVAEFKQKLAAAAKSRFQFDKDKEALSQFLTKLKRADSYQQAIEALPKL